MNFNRISQLSDLITNDLKRKPTIILKPNYDQPFRIVGTANDVTVNVDAEEWAIPDNLKPYVNDLCKSTGSLEEKILKIYQIICEKYEYDDNVLSYVQKIDDELYYLPDSYGRETDSIWKENRKKHNRRNCFEISRILAESINEIIKSARMSSRYDVCIFWDEAYTHYFVGLVSNEYYVSLDLDDFTKLKDITRLKTGLTIEGIKVYYDPKNKFTDVLNRFNSSRSKYAKEHIKDERIKFHERLKVDTKELVTPTEFQSDGSDISSDDIKFLQNAVQILKENYNLDSAGIFEYMKEIVDTKIGLTSRKKVWKKVDDNSDGMNIGNRYTRCLIVTIDDASYIIDVTKDKPEEMFFQFDMKELSRPDSEFKSNLLRNWDEEPYDGK